MLATSMVSFIGSIGLGTCMLKPAATALVRERTPDVLIALPIETGGATRQDGVPTTAWPTFEERHRLLSEA
jgi:hypothetical protein